MKVTEKNAQEVINKLCESTRVAYRSEFGTAANFVNNIPISDTGHLNFFEDQGVIRLLDELIRQYYITLIYTELRLPIPCTPVTNENYRSNVDNILKKCEYGIYGMDKDGNEVREGSYLLDLITTRELNAIRRSISEVLGNSPER